MGVGQSGLLGEIVQKHVEMELKKEEEHVRTHLLLMEEANVMETQPKIKNAMPRNVQVQLAFLRGVCRFCRTLESEKAV